MINGHTIEWVAETYIAPLGIKHPVRWLREHLASGDVPGKCISRKRGLWIMTDQHLEEWLNGVNKPADEVAEEPAVEPVSLADGLSARARRRLSA